MTRTAHERRKPPPRGRQRPQQVPDGAVYIGMLIIGVFAVLLAAIAFNVPWQHLALGYIAAMMVLVNWYAWRAYFGYTLMPWQQSMARVALRFANIGGADGRPFPVAKGDDRVRLMLLVSLAASSVVIAGASMLLIR